MAEAKECRQSSLYSDLCEGAEQAGDPAPQEDRVIALAALLRADAAAAEVPAGLVPSLRAALAEVALPGRAAPGLGALLRLLWAEARFLPASFLALEAALLVAALLANHYLAGWTAPRIPPYWPGGEPARDLLGRALLRDALGRSADAIALAMPWLGTAVALFAVLPLRRGLWADLEALSPFSGPVRLLARTAVATLVAGVGAAVAGLVHLGPLEGSAAGQGVPGALLLLARAAPLFLAVAWALAWSLRWGAPGAIAASFALWGGLTWFGGGLGRWDLFAAPGAAGPPLIQALALALAAALFVLVWAQAGRLEPRALGPARD